MSLKSKIIIIGAAIVATSAGFWLSSTLGFDNDDTIMSSGNSSEEALIQARKDYSPIQGSIISPARKINIPALLKDNGEPFTLDDLKGKWSLFFFGYTHCPDICPITMGITAQAKKLALESNQDFPQVIFISVDPERDKVGMLTEYVQYFDKDFIGVTGDIELIKALTLQLSVVYLKMDAMEGSDNYEVDHSSSLLLLNPEGKLVAFLSPPHDPKTILKDFQIVINLDE